MTLDVAALGAYAARVALVVLVAATALRLTRLRAPKWTFGVWRAAWLVCLLLPFVRLAPREAPQPTAEVSRAGAVLGSLDDDGAWATQVIVGGTAISALWLLVGFARLSRLRRDGEAAALPPSDESLRRSLAPRARVLWSDAVEQPATFGVWRPVVLLPRRVRTLPDDVRRAVLCHELVHVARRDWLAVAAEQATRAVLWFHPAVWWMLAELDASREQVVDRAVVALGVDRRTYLETLLWFADARPSAHPASAIMRRGQLRVRMLSLAQEVPMSRVRLVLATLACVVALASAIGAAVRAFPIDRPVLDLRATEGSPTLLGPTLRQAPWMRVFDSGALATPGSAASQREADVVLPKVVREQKPSYTQAAMDAKIQGEVGLSTVVTTDGLPSDIRVTKSLDTQYGLDQAAVAALEEWRFAPGTKGGKPVAVRVDIQMRFTLK